MTASEQSGWRVRSLLTALAVAGVAVVIVPFFLVPPAFVELALTDAVFGSDLVGEIVYVVDLERESSWAMPIRRTDIGFTTEAFRVPSGPVEFEITVPGYSPVRFDADLQRLASIQQAVALEPTFGRLEVRVVDATTPDQPVKPSAQVMVRDEATEATSDRSAVFELDEGRHEVDVAATGYCSEPQWVEIKAGETTQLTMRIPPDLTAGERARILLEWAENPRDLDAHVALSEPSRPLATHHVYFANRDGQVEGEGSITFAKLDVDWLNSEGIETITINDSVEGIYRYFVHHYAGDGSLGTSEATVVVVTAGCQRRRFEVPRECRQRWWHAADLEIGSNRLTIAERGRCLPVPSIDLSRAGKD